MTFLRTANAVLTGHVRRVAVRLSRQRGSLGGFP